MSDKIAFFTPQTYGKSHGKSLVIGVPLCMFDMYVKKALSPKTYLEMLNYSEKANS